jgi:glycosyltransferase involved in cell wall biosynthesis
MKSNLEELCDSVSVIMPVTGNPIYLHKSIESIRAQDHANFEALIVLNHSDDWVRKYLEGIVAADPRFKIIETTDKGISNALNIGISKSKHEFICRLDSDDLISPKRIIEQILFLKSNPNVAVVGTQVEYIDGIGNVIGKSFFPTGVSNVRKSLRIRNVLAHPSVMFRKTIVESVGFYNPTFDGVEDYELWLRISRITEVDNINSSLTSYRKWSLQETNKKNGRVTSLINVILADDSIGSRTTTIPSNLSILQLRRFAYKLVVSAIVRMLKKGRIMRSIQLISAVSINIGIEKAKSSDNIRNRISGYVGIIIGFILNPGGVGRVFFIPTIREMK